MFTDNDDQLGLHYLLLYRTYGFMAVLCFHHLDPYNRFQRRLLCWRALNRAWSADQSRCLNRRYCIIQILPSWQYSCRFDLGLWVFPWLLYQSLKNSSLRRTQIFNLMKLYKAIIIYCSFNSLILC